MKKEEQPKSQYMAFIGIGAELLGIEIAMIYIGLIVDEKMGWPGYALAGLSLFGLVVWLIHVVKMLQLLNSKEESSTPEDS